MRKQLLLIIILCLTATTAWAQQTLDVQILWNQLDSAYMHNTFLYDQGAYPYNVKAISYAMANVTEDVILRYTLKDYTTNWKNKLAVYYGEGDSIKRPIKGTKAEISKAGTFEVTVKPEQVSEGQYISYMTILSTKVGTLTYDIQVYTKSDLERANPVLEVKNKSMIFIEKIKGRIDPDTVKGPVNTAIRYSFGFDEIVPSLVGKELKLIPDLYMPNLGRTKLYYMEGDKRTEIEMGLDPDGSNTYFLAKDTLAVGNVEVDKRYDFLLISDQVCLKGYYVSMRVASIGGKPVPFQSPLTPLITTGHTVETDLFFLALKDTVVSVEDQGRLSLTLLTTVENTTFPASITVKMGGETLGTDQYEYDSTQGTISIACVTGDVFIVAKMAQNYKITAQWTNLTSTPAIASPTFVREGESFTFTLKADSGYKLPAEIEIMNGPTPLNPKYYTYDATTGVVRIEEMYFHLAMKASGIEDPHYEVVLNLTGATSEPASLDSVQANEKVELTLKAAEGYTLPPAIKVVMGEQTLAAGTGYTYDAATGAFALPTITGKLSITVEGVRKRYPVIAALTNLSSDIQPDLEIAHGEALTCRLVASDLKYGLPSSIEVTMGGKALAAETGYTYDPKTGSIEIKDVTAEVAIKAAGVQTFPVTETIENIGFKADPGAVKEGEPFACELIPAKGYKLPYAIKVMMGGRLLKQKNLLRAAGSEYYTYDNTTGAIEIEKVDGEISIEAKGVQVGYFEVIPNLIDLTSDPASFEPLAKGSKVELTLKAASGYTLPASITVTMGDKALTSTDYTYNSSTGAFTLEKIAGTLVITAAGNRIPNPEPEPEPTPTTYTVTLPVIEGATLTAESSTNVESGKNFAFTLTLKEGYSASNLTVKANGSVLLPASNGRYVIEKVTSNIVVTVTGIVKDNPTGNTEIVSAGLKVWGENGKLHIQTPVEDTAYIVTFDGRLHKALSLPIGETVTTVPQDSYIIYIGNQSFKIRF